MGIMGLTFLHGPFLGKKWMKMLLKSLLPPPRCHIGQVKMVGNSQQKQRYSYRDTEGGAATMLYYRLRQIDKDGQALFSKTQAVKLAYSPKLAFYPSPFGDDLTIQYEILENAQVDIADLQGRILRSFILTADKNLQTQEMGGLANGIYIATVKSRSSAPFIRKIIKLTPP
jgi:hypothetical protein